MNDLRMDTSSWISIGLLSFLWGGSFFFGKIAIAEMPAVSLVLLRVGIAAIALNAVALPFRRTPFHYPRMWGAFFVMGAVNNVIPFTLIFQAQRSIDSSVASVLNATTPMFTILLAHFLTSDEKMNGRKILGSVVGLVGVAVIVGVGRATGGRAAVLGSLAVVGAAISYSIAGIFARRFRATGCPLIAVAGGQLTASTVIVAAVTIAVDPSLIRFPTTPSTTAAVLSLAFLSTAVAYLLYFRVLSRSGATNVLLVTLLVPVSATLLGVFVLRERLLVRHWVGMACIAIGLLLIEGRLLGTAAKIVGRDRYS